MAEAKLEEQIEERQFAGLLQTQAEVFFRLSNTLLDPVRAGARDAPWTKKHYFQLISESDSLESFLDDYGARFNRTYAYLTELVASLRWFAYSGYSLNHLLGRLDSYGDGMWTSGDEREEACQAIDSGLRFLRTTAICLIESLREEARGLGVEITPAAYPETNFSPVTARRKLPRSVGQDELLHEEQRIAEVATKYLQAAEMVAETGVRPIEDPEQRHEFCRVVCTEELARVYEATVHNLQSTYDTHIQNTVLEGRDERLSLLRGHTSAALHLLQPVTYLAHFAERHETETRSEEAKKRLAELVDRAEVERFTLNTFLYWANRILQNGARVAEDLLPEYTNLQELELALSDELALHARPAALVVGIVNHHGTPVEMELAGKRCNAGSILELLVTVGSNPREQRFVFRGDERPLSHIRLLFEHGLGENGLEELPSELSYLRQQ